MVKQSTIRVYAGKGADRRAFSSLCEEMSDASISFLGTQELLEDNWEERTDILLMPGGRDVPYHQLLQGRGNQKIRGFVEAGGSYLGICAGAYFGCREVVFAKGSPIEVLGQRELAFFQGKALGPLFDFCYESEKGARALLLSQEESPHTPFYAYYNGGCYFEGASLSAEVKILAKYREIETQPAAIIEIEVEKGRVILSGVHLEMGAKAPPPYVEIELIEKIKQRDQERSAFLSSLLSRLSRS